jgi:hypothetical protein
MIERVRKAFNEGALLQEFIPCPEELRDTVAQFGSNDQEKANFEKFGYASWYDWQIAHWGTKWDIGADGQPAIDNDANTLSLNFDSAWAPPTNAYEKLKELGFTILAYYYEPGMAFCGKWDDGDDDYYEYSGMSSSEVAETIPDDLDECFCISEQMAEWEAEEEADNE